MIVAAQQREFPQLDYAGKAIAARLVRLGTLFIEAIGRVANRFGLSTNEYVILCALRAAGAPFTLPPKSINPLLSLTSGGMTNILHGLAGRGLIERLPDPSDRRGVLIRLTSVAVDLIGGAIEAHVAEEHRMIAGLSAKERSLLESLLSNLLISIEPMAIAPMGGIATAPSGRPGAKRPASVTRRAARATNSESHWSDAQEETLAAVRKRARPGQKLRKPGPG
jgi:DNA-binding MarR family transcriptional regulator